MHISFFLFTPVVLIRILALKKLCFFLSYNFLPFLFVLMLLSNLICIQITSPGGTPIRGKNAEMCLQLSRHSISCLPCPFSSGVSHLQLLLSALTLPALSLICTLPLLCLFWLVFSVIFCRLIHCDFCTVERGLFNGKFANWQMVPGLRHGRVDVSCSSCKSLDFPHSRSL